MSHISNLSTDDACFTLQAIFCKKAPEGKDEKMWRNVDISVMCLLWTADEHDNTWSCIEWAEVDKVLYNTAGKMRAGSLCLFHSWWCSAPRAFVFFILFHRFPFAFCVLLRSSVQFPPLVQRLWGASERSIRVRQQEERQFQVRLTNFLSRLSWKISHLLTKTRTGVINDDLSFFSLQWIGWSRTI